VETAVSVALIGASVAIIVVAAMLVIALGYVISILRRFSDSARHLKAAVRKIGSDVSGVLQAVARGKD
jgi:hypothetical protein